MNLNCTNKTIKYLMFVFNFVFVITGIIILALGVSVKAYYYPYDTFLDDKYFSLPNMLIATGSLIFFISFLGCYGAIRENWLMLMAFSVLLAIIFIFELSIGIAGYVLRDKTSSYLEAKLYNTMNQYNTSIAISDMWDLIQDEYHCCGVQSSADWQEVFLNYSLPMSCCPSVSGSIGALYCNSYSSVTSVTTSSPTEATVSTVKDTAPESNTTNVLSNATNVNISPQSASIVLLADDNTVYPPSSSTPYTIGCGSAFGAFIKAHAVDIGAVGITLAMLQLIGIFFAFHLARQLKNGYYST